jgi:hypothetical protein
VAGLAGLLFAVDEAHGFAVGFLANRNAFIAMVAAVGVLLLHQRWRTDGWRPGAWLAPSVLLVGLLSAEFSLFVTGYLFAYALFLDRGHSLVRRLATLVPYGVVVVGWRLVYKALGYGASASAAYIDPLDDFGRFADALLSRGPVLLLSQWTPLSSDPWIDRPDDQLVAFAPRALLGLAVIAAVVGPLLWRDRVARFFGVGMLLACVPVTATLPNDRLLLGIGIGAMGLVAQVIGRCWPGAVDGIRPVVGVWRRVPVKVLGAFFVVSHLVLAPLLLPLRAFMPGLVGNLEARSYESLARSRTIADRQVVLFNSLGWISYSVLAMMAYHGDDPPICIRQLSTTGDPLRVTRLDDRTLRLETHWSLLDLLMSRLMRPAMPLREGETIELPELTVTVERVSGSRPVSVRYQYRHSLDDDRFLWLTWREDDFRDVALPAEGESVELPGVSVARALLDPFRAAP